MLTSPDKTSFAYHFKALSPAIQELYDDCMKLAQGCQADLDRYDGNAPFDVNNLQLLASIAMAHQLPTMRRPMEMLKERTSALRDASYEDAYVLLKNFS